MAGLFDDIKNNFYKPNNALKQLIIINVIIFVVLELLNVILSLSGAGDVFQLIYRQFAIPANFNEFLHRPWTIITYAFTHSMVDFFHIIMNMLVLYWFGQLINEFLGSAKLVNLYVLGALAGAAFYLMLYNLVPALADKAFQHDIELVGASASVMAIVVGAAILLPDYQFHLIFIGPVKIKYIAMFYVLISVFSLSGGNAGGNIAHLGGAGIGWLYIWQLRKGNDFGLWIQKFLEAVKGFFTPRSKIKVSYRSSDAKSSKKKSSSSWFSGNKKAKKSTSTSSKGTSSKNKDDVSQDEIDKILDKISDKGYESLTKEEKQKLFNASKK